MEEVLSPQRTIAVFFDDDSAPYVFQLGETHADSEKEGIIHTHFPFGDQISVDEATFWNWVEGSRRERIFARLDHLQQDLTLAAMARAQFLTSLPVSKDLAAVDMTPAGQQRATVTTAVMRMNLPYFDRATFSSIARARCNEEAFEGFRDALDTALKEVTSLSDPDDIQRQIDEVTHDILARPIAKIDQQIKRFHKKLIPGSIVLTGSLIAKLVINGNTLAAAPAIVASAGYGVAEIVKAVQEQKEQRERIKELPSFFYWNVTRKKGRN